MRRASTVLTLSLAAAGLMSASSAQALGFGRVANATQLGQRLNFAAFVRLDPDEALERGCVFAEVLAGDNLLQPGQVRVTLEGGPDSPDRTVRVATSTVIDEPVVTVTVTVGCTSRATRKFVVFVDPPGIELAQSAPVDLGLLLPQRADSQVAPLLAITTPDEQSRAETPPLPQRQPSASAATRRPARQLADASPPPRRSASAVPLAALAGEAGAARKAAAAAPRRVAAASANLARPPAAGRLQLEAPAALAAAAPTRGASAPSITASAPSVAASAQTLAAASVAAGPASTAAGSEAQTEILARERQRIKSLEDDMTRLRADAAATQKTLNGLQARLLAAEADRRTSPLLLAIAALCGVLATGLLALLWRRSAASKAGQWWAGTAAVNPDADPLEPTPDAMAIPADREVLATTPSARPTPLLEDAPVTAVDVSLPGLATTSPRWASNRAPLGHGVDEGAAIVVSASMPLLDESSRELSVEELIDLEQQAEFFVVLGQDDAAIDLLTNHVHGEGGASPLPYLKLLEIHRRRGDREAYESIRAGFNRRFNAYAPDWDADLQQGRVLEEYPEVLARLQRLWVTPTRAMETLDASVFRRNRSDETFDLPAYRELLFLYTVARDQAEQGASDSPPAGQVDLLLPIGASPQDGDPISRLNATGSGRRPDFENSDLVTLPLDLDVSFAAELPPARPSSPTAPKVKVSAPAEASAPHPPAGQYYEGAETVPAALRRPVGYPDESAFVDLELEPVGPAARAGGR